MKVDKKLLQLVLIQLGLMILVFSGLVWVFFQWALPVITKHGQSISVPDLKGIQVAELNEFLTKRNLRFEITHNVAYSPDYPPSVVLEQYPKAGARVKEGRRIYLTLNASQPPKVRMPDLVDGSVRNAQLLLKSKGLSCGKIQYMPDIAKNAVLAQHYQGQPIAPGTPIAQGSRIDLVVGAGLSKQLVSLPDLVGMPLEEAELLLLDSGIRLGKVIYPGKDRPRNGLVCRQLPIAGAQVRFGETVDLWVAAPSQPPLAPEPDKPILEATE